MAARYQAQCGFGRLAEKCPVQRMQGQFSRSVGFTDGRDHPATEENRCGWSRLSRTARAIFEPQVPCPCLALFLCDWTVALESAWSHMRRGRRPPKWVAWRPTRVTQDKRLVIVQRQRRSRSVQVTITAQPV